MKAISHTNYMWIDVLVKDIKDYNNWMQRKIGMRPTKPNKDNEKHLPETVFKLIPPDFISKSKFKVGTAFDCK